MPEWRYSYKTPDGVRHEGSLRAATRDGVYAELRRRGIRPIRVELAPGGLNRLMALGKRGWSIVLLSVLALVLAVALGRTRAVEHPSEDVLRPRRQVAGLPRDWTAARARYWGAATAYLALFAQPGRMEFEEFDESAAFTEASLRGEEFRTGDAAPDWVRDLDGILAGMREEALALFRTGKPAGEIVLWLQERQRMEAAYRRQILESGGAEEEKRQRLEAMGL